MTRSLFALVLLAAASSVVAAPTSYVFDSVSKFDLEPLRVSLTGIVQGESTATTLAWADGNFDNKYVVSRCVPLLLTMMEKPGRYLFNLRIEPTSGGLGTLSCGLELRS